MTPTVKCETNPHKGWTIRKVMGKGGGGGKGEGGAKVKKKFSLENC